MFGVSCPVNQSKATSEAIRPLLFLLLHFPGISLGFTIWGEIFANVTVF